VTDLFIDRLRRERGYAPHDAGAAGRHECRGTLLSREQYLPDVARGWRDARLPPMGTMSPEEIELWTAAIERRDP
jgi:hypothetical protein